MCQGQKHLEDVMREYKKRGDSLTNKEKDSLKDMKIVQEMYARGPLRTLSMMVKDNALSTPLLIR